MLHTDASGQGLGAVLEQEQEDGHLHPIAFASCTLSKHERRYGVIDLEALGVVVFMDYLTKWVEAYAVPDQTSETIA